MTSAVLISREVARRKYPEYKAADELGPVTAELLAKRGRTEAQRPEEISTGPSDLTEEGPTTSKRELDIRLLNDNYLVPLSRLLDVFGFQHGTLDVDPIDSIFSRVGEAY
eukprot:Protomagalhaensia_wolfi_Nauph_80__3131@NODE_3197_length_860_cov_206_976857_g2505_i0_p1_GENE_NODE_3197_length_860_cov_206_976857_g2505_i0NODE_3197_length_860_cov_206_976857_g2505_i0_p1_ORF_typecomplete_len110_score5_91_NODE_3197_length_860_cov_206_976857_g2505_i0383712